MNRTSRIQGFNLVELMITILVAAILLAVALPSFRHVIQRNRVSSASNALIGSITYARSEAITRGQLVSMCPSTNGTACASGAGYEGGWLIYTYPAGAASANNDYAASDILLRAIGKQESVSVQSKNATHITFGQQGQLEPTDSPLPVFVICFRSGSSGVGTNTNEVPGVQQTVNGSGSTTSMPLASAAGCTP